MWWLGKASAEAEPEGVVSHATLVTCVYVDTVCVACPRRELLAELLAVCAEDENLAQG